MTRTAVHRRHEDGLYARARARYGGHLKVVWVSMLMIGLVLYFTHVESKLGIDPINGGVVLAVLSEFVFPVIDRV